MPKRVDCYSSSLLEAIEELSAIAQIGLTYGRDQFDLDRYMRVRELAADLMSALGAGAKVDILDWLSADEHYKTPKLDVRAVVRRGETILLVQEREDNRWTLPGGWCDIGEAPGEAVAKEVSEETGLEVVPDRLLALFDKRKHDYPFQIPHAYKAFFSCTEIGGKQLLETQETCAIQFFPLDDLPDLSTHRVTVSQLLEVVRIARDPTAPTAFD
ncbi:NUDIX hydrolase [Roseobacter weihaiensis]|uniref:NUDIX hydrolase n=1 Tax=Roseobacter weihaiensis TaxID=2763262 RepID=UPI001D0A912D|nr:NUDIX hydrolase [Roseobacter sp. H9]